MERKSYDYLKLKRIIRDVLVAMKIDEEGAELASDVLISSDLRGVDSHGLGRLKVYHDGLKVGTVNTNPEPKIIKDNGASVVVDADNGLGIVTAPRMMQLCMERAKKYGVGVVGTKQTNHFGMAGYYPMMASKQGMIGVTAANSLPLTAPFGSCERLLGSNPIAFSSPAGKYDAFTLDMATSNVALGKIEIAIRENQKVPKGWVIGPDGKDTDDPQAFFEGGALLPMAGPKGSGLAVFVDIFAALLVGSSVGDDVGYLLLNEKKEDIGHFMMAIDISKFRDLDEFNSEMEEYYETVKKLKKAEGFKEVFLPGEIEARISRERKEKGIPLNPVVAQTVLDLAKGLNLVDAGASFDDYVAQL